MRTTYSWLLALGVSCGIADHAGAQTSDSPLQRFSGWFRGKAKSDPPVMKESPPMWVEAPAPTFQPATQRSSSGGSYETRGFIYLEEPAPARTTSIPTTPTPAPLVQAAPAKMPVGAAPPAMPPIMPTASARPNSSPAITLPATTAAIVSPVVNDPVQAAPVQAAPAQVIPPQVAAPASPAQVFPAQALPVHAAPVQAGPVVKATYRPAPVTAAVPVTPTKVTPALVMPPAVAPIRAQPAVASGATTSGATTQAPGRDVLAQRLKTQVSEACPQARNVKVTFTGANDVNIELQTRTKEECNTFAGIVFGLRDLDPYRVNLKFSVVER